jgi:hypothetical protein
MATRKHSHNTERSSEATHPLNRARSEQREPEPEAEAGAPQRDEYVDAAPAASNSAAPALAQQPSAAAVAGGTSIDGRIAPRKTVEVVATKQTRERQRLAAQRQLARDAQQQEQPTASAAVELSPLQERDRQEAEARAEAFRQSRAQNHTDERGGIA